MFETLLGGVFGGVLRLAPELFKLFDKKNERAHELRMLEAEMEFAKIRGEIAMRQTEAMMTMAEMDTMAEAFKEQLEAILVRAFKQAQMSERTTLYNLFKNQGHEDMAEIIKRL